jgi:hypothetical protein
MSVVRGALHRRLPRWGSAKLARTTNTTGPESGGLGLMFGIATQVHMFSRESSLLLISFPPHLCLENLTPRKQALQVPSPAVRA